MTLSLTKFILSQAISAGLGLALALASAALMEPTRATAAPKKHSKVTITGKDGSAASCAKGGKQQLMVKVAPDQGLVVNTDGPWKLAAKNPTGATLSQAVWDKAAFDSKLPGFAVTVDCTAKKASFDYQIMAFVCTKDKKLCYFDRHEGRYSL